MTNNYLEPYFSPVLITDYIRENPNGMKRFQIYDLYHFLTSADSSSHDIVPFLYQLTDAPLSEDSFEMISSYLAEDFYFSPAFRSDSYDSVLLYYAIWLSEDSAMQKDRFLHQIFSKYSPAILEIDFSDSSNNLPFEITDACTFFGGLFYIACHAPAQLPKFLPEFAKHYQEEWHFTCEDFILYNFMDEYFEISNCRSNPKFQELISTLSLATLQAQDMTLNECTAADGLQQLKHPFSQLAGLYRYGALTFEQTGNPSAAYDKMKHLLDYAVTYELRRNLFDFHLDEDRIITLDNWKEKLKWYHVQYDSAYAHAISLFYSASVSQQLLKKQFMEKLNELQML